MWLFVQPGTAIVLPRHFLLVLAWILSIQTIPSAIAVLIRTQLPADFGNGSFGKATMVAEMLE